MLLIKPNAVPKLPSTGQQLTLGNYSGTVRSTSGAYTVLDVTNESGQRSTISLPNTLLLESVVTGQQNTAENPVVNESSSQP